MANIYCKTIGANQVSFYLRADGKDYFLCKQRYYKSLWDYFSGGVDIHALFTKSGKTKLQKSRAGHYNWRNDYLAVV